MKVKPFDLDKDIPSLANKVFLITGGAEAILALVPKQPAQIYFTGRNSKAAADVIARAKRVNPTVDVLFLECDHDSLASVHSAITSFLSRSQRLDVLLCNAGVMGTDASLTKDGYEHQFGINQMAHALMIKLLLPTLQSTARQTGDARVVFESSVGFRWTPSGGIRLDQLKTTQDYAFAGRWVRYGQSKLANVIYASELARRYPEITAVSVHPGVIWTNLWNVQWSLLNRIFFYLATLGQSVPVEEGVKVPCWAMTAPKEDLSPGAFYEKVGAIGAQSKDSQNKVLGEKLWTWTQKQLEAHE
ncbi:MAG: hypothetical protein Q9179_007477 [Wetmoreana sp. 5 TL-2023]